VTLQAFFDDSGAKGQGRYMVVAGLFGEASVFASIADEWDRWLRAKHPGSIRYFKMDEACTLDGEFRHWDSEKRDDKVRQMAKVINRTDLTEVVCGIDLHAFASFSESWTHFSGRQAFNQPYLLGTRHALIASAYEAIDRGSVSPLEVVFDEHDTYKNNILSRWGAVREALRPEVRAVLPIQPWFRDDKNFVVLQAADLVAGDYRLRAEERSDLSFIGTLLPDTHVSPRSRVFDESTLSEWSEEIRGVERLSQLGPFTD
jgi:uncharacterized protein DUF3800